MGWTGCIPLADIARYESGVWLLWLSWILLELLFGKNWLCAIALNLVRDHFRALARRPETPIRSVSSIIEV